jgi:hypothetical protein
MKNIILTLLFIVGMVLGAMMVFFENPLGEYVIAVSVFVGLYVMHKMDKELNEKEEESFF